LLFRHGVIEIYLLHLAQTFLFLIEIPVEENDGLVETRKTFSQKKTALQGGQAGDGFR
jgi:hypothetical protein